MARARLPLLCALLAQAVRVSSDPTDGSEPWPRRAIVGRPDIDSPSDVAVADIDKDGCPDLVSSAIYGSSRVAWFRSESCSGTAAFSALHLITGDAADPEAVELADLDGDGWTDVLSASPGSTIRTNVGGLAWYRNLGGSCADGYCPGSGSAQFGAMQMINTVQTSAVAVGDLNNDGRLDVVAGLKEEGRIVVHRNRGGGTPFVASASGDWQLSDLNQPSPCSVAVADVSGDGWLDVVTATRRDDTVAWHRNLQPATASASWFSSRNTITSSADGAQSIAVADLDGDSRPDVVASSQLDDTIAWYRNGAATGASTSFTEHVITNAAEEALSLELADLNGDGRLEVLSASEDDDSIAWFANLGGGDPASLFGEERQILASGVRNAKSVVGADLDGDGRVDVLSLSPIDDTIAWSPNPVSLPVPLCFRPARGLWRVRQCVSPRTRIRRPQIANGSCVGRWNACSRSCQLGRQRYWEEVLPSTSYGAACPVDGSGPDCQIGDGLCRNQELIDDRIKDDRMDAAIIIIIVVCVLVAVSLPACRHFFTLRPTERRLCPAGGTALCLPEVPVPEGGEARARRL